MTMTAVDYLTRGHLRAAPIHERERQRDLATRYQPNPLYDRIIERRAEEGDVFWHQLTTTTRIAVGHYILEKAAFQAERKEGDAT